MKGFYYDIDMKKTLTPEDLEAIEMNGKNCGRETEVKREEMSKADAIKYFSSIDEAYKIELHE